MNGHGQDIGRGRAKGRVREPLPGSAPLARRIRDAERRLLHRRISTGLRLVAVGQSLRVRVGMPLALVAAAGAGFVLGRLARGPSSTPVHEHAVAAAGVEPTPEPGRTAVIASLLDALALVEFVMAILPAPRRTAGDESPVGPESTGAAPKHPAAAQGISSHRSTSMSPDSIERRSDTE